MNAQLLIYANRISNRLQYIVDTIFFQKAILTDDDGLFKQHIGKKIAYTIEQPIDACLWLKPHGLLAETTIKEQVIDCFAWKNTPIFFKTAGDIPFDFLAASFFLITRYEEYYPNTKKDKLNRYLAEQSLAYKENFLNRPLINIWLSHLVEEQIIPETYKRKRGNFQPTYDIDIAYSYRYHSVWRNVGGFFRDMLTLQVDKVEERILVIEGKRKDPYDVYDWLHLLHDSLNLKPIYFLLLAEKRNEIDKNISATSDGMKILIKKLALNARVGLHPSSQTRNRQVYLEKEMSCIEAIIHENELIARQHYILLDWPNTYRSLIDAGVSEDYSMGYPTVNGFRASCSFSFYWFDLLADKTTELLVHPFCYMDSTAIFHERLSSQAAGESLDHYYRQVQDYGGTCTVIHHNNFLTEQKEFMEWRLAYVDFLLRHFMVV